MSLVYSIEIFVLNMDNLTTKVTKFHTKGTKEETKKYILKYYINQKINALCVFFLSDYFFSFENE